MRVGNRVICPNFVRFYRTGMRLQIFVTAPNTLLHGYPSGVSSVPRKQMERHEEANS
jgi:hypothetical protein